MDSFKQSITKGITALNVKTNNFMEESKCKTYIVTLQNEIKELKNTIGNQVYENWVNGKEIGAGTEELLAQIKAKTEEIAAQEEKMRQLQEEERQILGNNAPQKETEDVIFCSQCGTKNAANYKFCCKCGTPLK